MSDIDASDSLVTVGTHLTGPEAQIVKTHLEAVDVHYVVTGHSAASRYNSLYYEVKVKGKDKKTASRVIGKMRAKDFIGYRKCPRCKTLKYREVEKKGLWEKLYYLGTTLVQCQKCKTRYSI